MNIKEPKTTEHTDVAKTVPHTEGDKKAQVQPEEKPAVETSPQAKPKS